MSEYTQPVRLTGEEWHGIAEFIDDLRGWLLSTIGEDSTTMRAIDDRLTTAAAGLHYLAENDPEGCVFTAEEQPGQVQSEIEEGWEI